MKIDPNSLEELKRICAESFDRHFSDSELQDIGQRIVRFLRNSDDYPEDPEVPTLTKINHVR